MNKKFSTLLASVLLTSAFSVNAADYKPVEGDYVRLLFNSEYLQISGGDLSTDDAASTTVSTEADRNKAMFAAINSQLWKIAKVTKNATTGQSTYQFINKQTGEYLAFKLRTNTEDFETEYEAELDPAGNKEWAFDKDGRLYAYDAKQDSTFFLTSGLKLASKKGYDVSEATKVKLTDVTGESISLNASAFNVLMRLTGNDAKLHFNGKKNVSADEKNILENTKWEAKQGNDYIYLTDGSTKSGYTNNLATYTESGKTKYYKIDKRKYLQVDTLSYDDAGKYFALVTDTVPYDQYEEVENKYIAGNFFGYSHSARTAVSSRNNATAEWKANFFIANDSIALKVKAVPEKMAAEKTTYVSTLTGKVAEDDYITKYSNAVIAAAAHKDWQDAITALDAAYRTFITQTNSSETEKSFATDNSTNINLLKNAGDDALKAYAEALENVKQAAATPVSGTAPALEGYQDKLDAVKLISDYETNWKTITEALDGCYNSFKAYRNNSSNVMSFATTIFDSNRAIDFVGTNYPGSQYISNLSGSTHYASLSSLEKKAVDDYLALFADWEIPAKTVTPGTAQGAANYESLKASADAAAGQNTALVNALAAVDKAYKEFIAQEGKRAVDAVTTFKSENESLFTAVGTANTLTNSDVTAYLTALEDVKYEVKHSETSGVAGAGKQFTNGENALAVNADVTDAPVALRKLSSATVLTVNADGQDGYIYPLIQPYATTGGDAKIATTNYHFIQVKNEAKVDAPTLRAAEAAIETNKYWIVDWKTMKAAASTEVSEYNPFTQWAFVETSTGAYSIINRATEQVMYTGPLFKVADATDTYTNGTDTLKIAAVTLPESTIITEGGKKYDVAGSFYPGKDESLIKRLFTINPVSPFMSQLSAQFNKDSVMILGDAADAPVWQLEEVKDSKGTYGYVIEGTTPLLAADYHIYTKDRDENVYYVTLNEDKDGYILTKSTSKLGAKPSEFSFIEVAKDQYVIVDDQAGVDNDRKMTINPTPAKPILEASVLTSERNDLFTFTQVNQNVYRTLAAEDGVLSNAKIYMENEPNRYLYENTANIVANNGTGYNFLGIYNTAELTKNAALYVDTAYVNREDNLMPQYMFALGVDTVDAKDAVACTYEHNHYDNAGNKVDAEHCSHATPATMGYKTGRYLVALSDSVPTTTKVHPTLYDGAIRLAFVPAIHRNAEDSLIIKNSKWTGNSKQQVADKETTWAAKDTMKIADQSLNPATFALLIKDQATKSFYLENKEGYVRILNGVPVLTTKLEDAAVFNIEATTEEATANEAIEAATVQVIAGKGVVTVQGAAGKVVTVANILGQTIANQVAASDNVTIAAPAGVLVVTVDGEATKVVVK